MSGLIGVFALGLMVVVLAIAVFSLVVVVIIPIGRYLEKKSERASKDPSQ